MKSIVVHVFGGPEALHLEDVPDPEPRPFYQPNNGTCVLSFWGCRAEPTSPIVVPPDPPDPT